MNQTFENTLEEYFAGYKELLFRISAVKANGPKLKVLVTFISALGKMKATVNVCKFIFRTKIYQYINLFHMKYLSLSLCVI